MTFENEAFLTQKELAEANLEIVYPSVSILAEPPVAVVNKYAATLNPSSLLESMR